MVAGSQEIFMYSIILFIFLFFVWIFLIVWITKDAKKRGKNGTLWGAAAFFLPSIAVLLYLIVRPIGELARCNYCGKEKLETLPECPHCHNIAHRGIKESKTKNETKFKKVFNQCQDCGEVTNDVENYEGMLLCKNCRSGEVYEDGNEVSDEIDSTSDIRITDLPTHTLIVEVKNKFNNEPLSKANVLLQSDTEKLERISDIDGKVIFGKVKEGIYTLNVSSRGFEEVSQGITLNKNDRISVELKGKANITINVMDIINEGAIADAIINLGDREVVTDEKGLAAISDVAFGKYELTVTKESYKIEPSILEIKEIQQNIKIFLKPDIKPNEEYIIQGERLRNSLNESMKKISSACDMCIPEYYRSICHELIKLNETIAATPVYVYSDQSADKIDTLYRITGMICREMEAVLTNSENITDFISMADRNLKTIPEITINPSDYDIMIQAYMKDPVKFTVEHRIQILNKLQETDKEITNNLQTFNINPIANLWSISQRIISSSKNEYDVAASLLLANILLDATKKMFKTEEIIKRLKK